MPRIETLYVANHSHTDIGFTDQQDACFRQHAEFIDQAAALCEATADYPPEARYRWVCEVTGTTERYLDGAGDEARRRFLRWHRRGAIDVAGMQYNLTPLLDVEQLHRSLYPVRRLRERYGLNISTAMQCDVDGVSWLFADLLPQVGIDFLTMAVNPIRGRAPQPRPSAFWWEGPAGGRVLAWNGYHYLFGRSTAKLGDWRFVDRSLPPLLRLLEEDPGYPFDFLYCQATHPTRVDNGPPQRVMADFVREWNERGRTPRIQLTTPSAFGRMLRERHGAELPVRRGDWTDWWADGVASSAYETGLNRGTHEMLRAAEAVGAWGRGQGEDGWDTARAQGAYELSTLYDEHTWGAFASIDAPRSAWTRAQWNRKSGFAYQGWSEAHDLLARATDGLAGRVAERGVDGIFNLGDVPPVEAYPDSGSTSLLVVNTLPWERSVLVDEPELRGGTAPAAMLDMFVPEGVPWGGDKPEAPLRRVAGTVPGYGWAFLDLASHPPSDDLQAGPGLIENRRYRVRVDQRTGALSEWLDKDLGHDFAGSYSGWGIGQYVYERVEGGRDALFAADFSDPEFGHGRTDTSFRRTSAERVKVGEPLVAGGRASITVEVSGPGIRGARCTFALESGRDELHVDWLLDKEHVTEPEAVLIAFPFALGTPSFLVDLNGVPCRPNQDQLKGSVRDWYPTQRWVHVSDGELGVTLAPLDAPLVQLGGITTGRWAAELEPEAPAVMSWALHNHWMVNFKASQGGEIPLRYRLTTNAGPSDAAAAARFGSEQATPPLVLRDLRPSGAPTGRFLELDGDDGVLLSSKPAEDGDGVILRLRNVRDQAARAELRFPGPRPVSVNRTSPIEEDRDALAFRGESLVVPLEPLQVMSLRLRFAR